MAVYVDKATFKWRGRLWCHLVADSLVELHDFAKTIGMREEWFQVDVKYPHYDLHQDRREIALQHGAVVVDRRTLIFVARKLKKEFCLQVLNKPEQMSLF